MDAGEESRKAREERAEGFRRCAATITALGDENRQRIVCAMLLNERPGMRIEEITSHTELSRPAVSHHVKVLKDAGIVTVSRKGTMNFYYLDPHNDSWQVLADLSRRILAYSREFPGCKEEQT